MSEYMLLVSEMLMTEVDLLFGVWSLFLETVTTYVDMNCDSCYMTRKTPVFWIQSHHGRRCYSLLTRPRGSGVTARPVTRITIISTRVTQCMRGV